MDQQEISSCPCAAEYACSNVAQKKTRAAVVAESQKEFGFPFRQRTLPVEICCVFCPGGVSAHKSCQKRRGADAPQTKERNHERRAEGLQQTIQPQLEKKGGNGKKRKEGRDHSRRAESETALHRKGCLAGAEKKRCRKEKRT